MGEKKLHAESDWSKWYLVKDKNKQGQLVLKIRRYKKVEGKTVWDRYPSKNYRDMDLEQVETLLNQLNSTFLIDQKHADEQRKYDHSYVNELSIGKFRKHIEKRSTDKGHVNATMEMLQDYVFAFFINLKKIPDPSRWHLKEDEWGEHLLAQDLSPRTLRKIVGTANRFTTFLVQKVYPHMPTPRKLEPIGRAVLNQIEVERSKTTKVKTKYISEDAFNKILTRAKNEDPEVIPNILLCKHFGLRISETQGLTKDKFLRDSLLVDEQGDRVHNGEIVRKKVKTFERRVPYWNLSAKEAWALVKEVRVMHPDTLNRRVNAVLAPFGHTSHDFRRTFITNSFRKAHWKDVMKAAGHSDVRTTMGYDQDDRNLSDEKADLD